jgi:hypothetical protein
MDFRLIKNLMHLGLWLTVGAALSACSMGKDVSDTRKTTQQMNDTTKDMDQKMHDLNDTTQKLNKYSKQISERTNDLEREAVTDSAYRSMTENLDKLFGRDATPGTNDSSLNPEPDMVSYAGAIIYSMSFQYWKNNYDEDIAFLDWRFDLSSEALMTRCLKHIPRDFEVDVLNPNYSYKAIASLGSKLELELLPYSMALQQAGLSNMSLYDVMMLSLRDRNQVDRTEQLPKTIAFLQQFIREVEYIIQLRHNYLPIEVVARMVNSPESAIAGIQLPSNAFQDQGMFGRGASAFLTQRIDLGLGSNVDALSGKNTASNEQLKEWTHWLNEAYETRQSLKAMGIAPRYNQMFLRILQKVDFGQKDIAKLVGQSRGGAASARIQLLSDFASAYDRVAYPDDK